MSARSLLRRLVLAYPRGLKISVTIPEALQLSRGGLAVCRFNGRQHRHYATRKGIDLYNTIGDKTNVQRAALTLAIKGARQ